ncbi:hypothetical protein ACFVRU_00250 [Streptomyces sp. NPDC057927]
MRWRSDSAPALLVITGPGIPDWDGTGRECQWHTNTKLHTVAEAVMAWALAGLLPGPVDLELDAAVQRRSHRGQTPDQPE